jgi:hypothetical protein
LESTFWARQIQLENETSAAQQSKFLMSIQPPHLSRIDFEAPRE